jgi:hypothetical protein
MSERRNDSGTFTRAGNLKSAPEYDDKDSPRLRHKAVGGHSPEQIAARARAGWLDLSAEGKQWEWYERKAREAAISIDEDEEWLSIQQAREEAQAQMDAPRAPLLDALFIAGRKRWKVFPRYSDRGWSQQEEEVLYLLRYLPPEVEWAFWMADRNLILVGSELQPCSVIAPSLQLLHDYAEGDALRFARAAVQQREDDRTRPYRDRMIVRMELWHWADTVDDRGDLVEVFVPRGYSLPVWGRPRHLPFPPTFHLKRSERNDELLQRLAGSTIEEYLTEAAREAGYTFEEFVAKFPRGRLSSVEKKRRAALARTLTELGSATQQRIADVTGLSQDQVSRLQNAHEQGKT